VIEEKGEKIGEGLEIMTNRKRQYTCQQLQREVATYTSKSKCDDKEKAIASHLCKVLLVWT
jgi:hypothetical protein